MPSCCHSRFLHEPQWIPPLQEAVRLADRTSSGGHARPGRDGLSSFHGREGGCGASEVLVVGDVGPAGGPHLP